MRDTAEDPRVVSAGNALMSVLERQDRIPIMSTTSIKEQARQVVEQLPDDATFDDLVYRVYVRQKIEAGLQACEEGRLTSHEEVLRRYFDE